MLGSFHGTLLSLRQLLAWTESLKSLHKKSLSPKSIPSLVGNAVDPSTFLPGLLLSLCLLSLQPAEKHPANQGRKGWKRTATVTHPPREPVTLSKVRSSSLIQATL